MKYMNDYDIEVAKAQACGRPTLKRAVLFLAAFRDEVNANSDGWAHWAPPVRAAAKLMEFIELWARHSTEDPTKLEFLRTLGPIRAFYTRRGNAAGMKFPTL